VVKFHSLYKLLEPALFAGFLVLVLVLSFRQSGAFLAMLPVNKE
jgi:hypothetical protein